MRPGHTDPTTIGDEFETQRVHPRLARPGPRGRRAVHGARRAGDARAARRRLRRRAQGLGPLARRARRHRPRLAGPAPGLTGALVHAADEHEQPGGRARDDGEALGGAAAAHGRARAARRDRGGEVRRHVARRTWRARPTRPPTRSGRRQVDAARQIVRVLGSMKGVAMKAGQVLSVVDLEAVPPEYRDEVRATLAELRDSAPSVALRRHAARARARVRRARWTACSRRSTRSRSPPRRSARSTARACDDGREVAVKVQYPGIAAAVRADLQNLVPMLRIAKQIAPGPRRRRRSPTRSASASTRSSTTSSRPQNTRAVARAHRGHPFIVIPEVVTDLCRARVIVMDFVDGVSHEEIALRDQADARPRRRDDLPLLLRRDVPPPRVLRRPASRELAAARRRAHGVPGLRPVQADLGRGGRARARDPAARRRGPRRGA